MNRCLVRLLCLVLCLSLFPLSCLSEQLYLIPDSDSRRLTAEELWGWDYESLGYILNEIFARHGYVFISGGQYAYYFKCMPWYQPNANPDNQTACYPQLNSVEWYNEQLIKSVRAEMRALGTQNRGAKSVWDNFSTGFDSLQGFSFAALRSGQKFSVYSAPDAGAFRAANGKASVSTNGAVFAAGYESGWLLVMYETNNGSVRVGYVKSSEISGTKPSLPQLSFAFLPAVTTAACQLTDDPARCFAPLMTLPAGAPVTYLSTFFNRSGWDYVETTINGQRVRGFIRTGALSVAQIVDAE